MTSTWLVPRMLSLRGVPTIVAGFPKQRGTAEEGDAGSTAREAPTASRHQKRDLLTFPPSREQLW
jgi:hypothetical protein